MIRQCLSIAIGGSLLIGGDVQAHHSRAMFDLRRQIELSGTVRVFQFTNPHCYIQLVVKNAAGRDEEWAIEMGPPHSLRERGWGKFSLRQGDRVKVTIAPLRSGDRGGELDRIERLDGKPLGIRQ